MSDLKTWTTVEVQCHLKLIRPWASDSLYLNHWSSVLFPARGRAHKQTFNPTSQYKFLIFINEISFGGRIIEIVEQTHSLHCIMFFFNFLSPQKIGCTIGGIKLTWYVWIFGSSKIMLNQWQIKNIRIFR